MAGVSEGVEPGGRLRDRLSIPDLIDRHPGRRGVAELRRVIAGEPVGVTKRELEEAFLALLDSRAIPRGRLNSSIWVRDQFYEPDCLWWTDG